jgi:hypothetical protein
MATRACQTCGRRCALQDLTGDRCPRCARYWSLHGVEYTPRAASPTRPCQTCGQVKRWLRRGRCTACYNYWYRTGQERPPRLWQRQ